MSGTTPANASAYGYTQYDQELKKSITNLGVGKVDGLLACYNEDAALAYECRTDATCCGSGPKMRDDGAWNKCCLAGNNSGFELDIWVTLAACLGILVLFVAGVLLYVERVRRGALRKSESSTPAELTVEVVGDPGKGPKEERSPDATGTSNKVNDKSAIVVMPATASPASSAKREAQRQRRGTGRLVSLKIKQRLFGSPTPSPDSSPHASHSPASGTPTRSFQKTIAEEGPESPAYYPNSPGVAAEAGKTTGVAAPGSRSHVPSRFQKERNPLGEITPNPQGGSSNTPSGGGCVNLGSSICPPSAERISGKENAV